MKPLFGFSRRGGTRPRALLAWEIGAGFTHARNLAGVAWHLRQMGIDCFVAVADPPSFPWARKLGVDVAQTYVWPAMRSMGALPEQRPARGLTDIFANYAISRPNDLAAALDHYDALFRLVRPDVVLCENAFGALLAARGRLPTVVFGSTLLYLPPIAGDGFAPIDPANPEPSWPIAGVLGEINSGLSRSGRPHISTPAELLSCDARAPFGPAAFDPYLDFRGERVLSPFCPDLPLAMTPNPGDENVIYLHDVAQFSDQLMDAVAALAPPTRLFIPSLRPDLRVRFEARGHLVEQRPLRLSMIAQRAAILIHQGGVTMTAAALALGVPQIILARFHENGLAGAFIAREGLGETRRLDSVDPAWLTDAVARIRADRTIHKRCRDRASDFRGWFDEDPTATTAAMAARLAGVNANLSSKNLPAEFWT